MPHVTHSYAHRVMVVDITHCRGGLMYVHVIGWETAKKDKIDLEGSKLKEKQGLYTCPPSSPNQLPFHCCLEVKEEQIKVSSFSSFSHLCVAFC